MKRPLKLKPTTVVPVPERSFSLARYTQMLTQRFFVRFHMFLMLSGVCLAGLGLSKLLLELGVRTMLPRYLIAVTGAYLAFFCLVRLWLWYIAIAKPAAGSSVKRRKRRANSSYEAPDLSGADLSSGSGGSDWSFGGGSSGGGGASDSWMGASLSDAYTAPASGSSGSTNLPSSGGWDWSDALSFGGDDEGIGCLGLILALLALALALLAIFGAGVYVIYQAPAILAEAAFEVALASGLARAAKRMERGGWVGSIFQATWKPFALVVVTTALFGAVAHHYCPAATKVTELFSACKTAD